MHRENLQYAAIFLIYGPKLINSPHFAAQARINKKPPKSRRFNIRSIRPSSTLSSFLKGRDSKSSKVLEVTPVRTI